MPNQVNLAEALFSLAEKDIQLNQATQANHWLDSYFANIAHDNNFARAKGLKLQGKLFLFNQKPIQAAKVYTERLDLLSKIQAKDYLLVTHAYLKAGDSYLNHALVTCEKALIQCPYDLSLLTQASEICETLGDLNRALDYLELAMTGKEKLSDIYFRQYRIYRKQGKVSTACRSLMRSRHHWQRLSLHEKTDNWARLLHKKISQSFESENMLMTA